jgi:alkanesulfonate monooxygenase SsuD/methylene tetrahydromethanopterin reductase-like flavin-dependent oxidoreductase (luciferase family)
VFEVEHHFLEEYSHSSAPEMMLAALSQRTKNIRLGHGITLTPPAYNPPARVAERISALDILSNGRVEFGTGESASHMELAGFGVQRGLKKSMWEEATREITNMMVHTPYKGFEGQYFSMPERNVIPKPLQKPHPPLWVAASRRETTMVAGRLGMGSLGFGFETAEELGERAREYYRLVREECMPIGHAVNPALAVLNSFMIGDTDEQALERSAGGPGFFSYSLGYYYNPITGGRHQPGKTNVYRRYRDTAPEARAMQRGFVDEAEIRRSEPGEEVQRALYRAARTSGSIGTLDRVRKNLMRYEEQHLDTVIFVAQAGDRKHEHIMESIERFGKQVLPDFKERHETIHRKWRNEQLAGVEHPINSSI